jgi:hypothetical protein
MKMYGGVEVCRHTLTLALDRDEWSVSYLAALFPGKEPTIPIEKKAGQTPELVSTQW